MTPRHRNNELDALSEELEHADWLAGSVAIDEPAANELGRRRAPTGRRRSRRRALRWAGYES